MHSLIADRDRPVRDRGAASAAGCARPMSARDAGDRIDAMRGLWDEARRRRPLRAASSSPPPPPRGSRPRRDRGDRADDLIASMLTAGYDRHAARWGGGRRRHGRRRRRPRLGDPRGRRAARRRSISAPAGSRPSPTATTAASAAGCWSPRWPGSAASTDPASPTASSPAPRSRWAECSIAAAARSGQPGTVALLAGVGMQTGELARRSARASLPYRPRAAARSASTMRRG